MAGAIDARGASYRTEQYDHTRWYEGRSESVNFNITMYYSVLFLSRTYRCKPDKHSPAASARAVNVAPKNYFVGGRL